MSAVEWLRFKTEIVAYTGLDRDALHIYVSILIQLFAALILRRRLSDWLPWLAVLAASLLNEAGDLNVEIWPDPMMQAGAAMHDIVNSLILPTALMIVARWFPGFISRRG